MIYFDANLEDNRCGKHNHEDCNLETFPWKGNHDVVSLCSEMARLECNIRWHTYVHVLFDNLQLFEFGNWVHTAHAKNFKVGCHLVDIFVLLLILTRRMKRELVQWQSAGGDQGTQCKPTHWQSVPCRNSTFCTGLRFGVTLHAFTEHVPASVDCSYWAFRPSWPRVSGDCNARGSDTLQRS